jgi:hypothetical protein
VRGASGLRRPDLIEAPDQRSRHDQMAGATRSGREAAGNKPPIRTRRRQRDWRRKTLNAKRPRSVQTPRRQADIAQRDRRNR